MGTRTQSEICAEKYGIERKILKDEGEIYPACVKKDTEEVVWDVFPGCSSIHGECLIHKLEKYAQENGLKILKMKFEVGK